MNEIEKDINVNLNESSDNKAYISIIGAIIVVICFFLPWIEIDCMGKKNLSGADIGGILWAIPIGAAIFIFAFYSFYKRKEISKIVLTGLFNFFGSIGIIAFKYLSFTENLKKELGSSPESLGISPKYGGIITIIGEILILIGCAFLKEKVKTDVHIVTQDSNETISQLEKLGKLKEQNLITEEEFLNQKSIVLNSQKTEVVKKASFINNMNYSDNIGKWFNKNKKSIFSIGSAIILLLLVYFLFIKNDPVRDGKSTAGNYCDCSKQYAKDLNKAKEDFVKTFDSYNFQNRNDARKKLREISAPFIKNYEDCNEKARTKNDEYRTRYIDNNEALMKYDNSYSSNSKNCNSSDPDELAINSKVSNKINTLKETEPDNEKIKNDLLGNKILGWNFDYLSEFKQFDILNTTKNNDRLEYRIKLELLDQKENSLHEVEIVVIYQISDDGWVFNAVSENYITYDNELPDDKWKTITPLKDCRLTFDIDKKFTMKTNEYSEEYHFGPDSDLRIIPYSTNYLVKSREGKPIKVRFKYTLNK